MTLRWIATPPECQNLRFSVKSMLGILVRRTSIPLRNLRLELRASPHNKIFQAENQASISI